MWTESFGDAGSWISVFRRNDLGPQQRQNSLGGERCVQRTVNLRSVATGFNGLDRVGANQESAQVQENRGSVRLGSDFDIRGLVLQEFEQ